MIFKVCGLKRQVFKYVEKGSLKNIRLALISKTHKNPWKCNMGGKNNNELLT